MTRAKTGQKCLFRLENRCSIQLSYHRTYLTFNDSRRPRTHSKVRLSHPLLSPSVWRQRPVEEDNRHSRNLSSRKLRSAWVATNHYANYYALAKTSGKQYRLLPRTKDRKLAEPRLSEFRATIGPLFKCARCEQNPLWTTGPAPARNPQAQGRESAQSERNRNSLFRNLLSPG